MNRPHDEGGIVVEVAAADHLMKVEAERDAYRERLAQTVALVRDMETGMRSDLWLHVIGVRRRNQLMFILRGQPMNLEQRFPDTDLPVDP